MRAVTKAQGQRRVGEPHGPLTNGAPEDYTRFIGDLKARVVASRVAAALPINRELIALYWDIGKAIIEQQHKLGWGKSVVEQIARDLRAAFPSTEGFSARKVWDMRRFYDEYTRPEFLRQLVADLDKGAGRRSVGDVGTDAALAVLRQVVAEVPWGQHLLVMSKVGRPEERAYYLRTTAKLDWSRSILLNQIKAKAYERSLSDGKSHNFSCALPSHFAEQAEETLKSRYNLEFLGIGRHVRERELEDRLIDRLRDFILELGYGFCFIGRQCE